MTDPDTTDRTRIAAELGADPWYQLSTAGQERFHTNLLYRLVVNRPGESRPVWELLGVDAPLGAGPD